MKEMKGILVFYVDVGQLPPFKAEAFLESFKDTFYKDQEKGLSIFPAGVGIVWVPSRPPTRTRVEYIAFESADDRRIERLAAILEEWDVEWEDHLEECTEPEENVTEFRKCPTTKITLIEKLKKAIFRSKE